MTFADVSAAEERRSSCGGKLMSDDHDRIRFNLMHQFNIYLLSLFYISSIFIAAAELLNMSPMAVSSDPTPPTAKASSSKTPPPPPLGLSNHHFTTVKSHFLDLSETTESFGDGTRTPRPGNLTPSPPRSRAGSNTGKEEKRRSGEVKNGNGKRNLDGKGRLWKEEEGEVARLMRTVDFAARVSS
jgi:hypothetical protein